MGCWTYRLTDFLLFKYRPPVEKKISLLFSLFLLKDTDCVHAEIYLKGPKNKDVIPYVLDPSNQCPTQEDIRTAQIHAKNFDFSSKVQGQDPGKNGEEEKVGEKDTRNVHTEYYKALREINEICLDMSKLPSNHAYFHEGVSQSETNRLLHLRDSKKGELGALSHDFSSETGDVFIKNSLFVKAKLYLLQFSNDTKKVKTKGTSKKVANKLTLSDFQSLMQNPCGEKSLKKYTENFTISNSKVVLNHYQKKVTDTLVQKKWTFPGKLARYTMSFGNLYLFYLRIASSVIDSILTEICNDS